MALNVCPLQNELTVSRPQNKYSVKFCVVKLWYIFSRVVIRVLLLCEVSHAELQPHRCMTVICIRSRDAVLRAAILLGHCSRYQRTSFCLTAKQDLGLLDGCRTFLLFLLFSGWNLHLPGSRKIESGSSYQQLTISSTTLLKCSNTPMQPTAITGASGACT